MPFPLGWLSARPLSGISLALPRTKRREPEQGRGGPLPRRRGEGWRAGFVLARCPRRVSWTLHADQNTAPTDQNNGKPEQEQPAPAQWEVSRVLKVTKPLMEGEDVKALQLALIANGYHCGVAGASGIFEKYTAYAVRCFQSSHGLIVDGKAGRFTVAALGGVWKG